MEATDLIVDRVARIEHQLTDVGRIPPVLLAEVADQLGCQAEGVVLEGVIGDELQRAALLGIHGFILDRLERRRQAGSSVPSVDYAAYNALFGRTDKAFRWLERAYTEHELALPVIAERSAFSVLRDDPRFTALIARLGLG